MKKKHKLVVSFSVMIISLLAMANFPYVLAQEQTDTAKTDQEVAAVSEETLNQEQESTVVQGADGLLYVVADKSDKEQLLSSDTPQIAEKTEGDFTAVEVGIDEKRQEKADQADQEIKDFDEIDLNDVESLQSAVNSEDLPFIEEDQVAEELAKTKNTEESEQVLMQTRFFYAEEILNQTNNLNDVPSMLKESKVALLASVSKTVSETTINPPSGYPWLMYIVRSNGYSYTEDRGIRRTIDGKDAFCLQAGVTAAKTYTDAGSSYLSTSQKETITSIISAYRELGGWANNDAGKQRWMAAQILVWENSNEKPKSITITPNHKAGVTDWKSKMTTRAGQIRTRPQWDATSKTVYEGEKATFTVKNSWGDHNLYVESVSGGAKATISGNKLTVDTNGSTATKITVNMVKGSKTNEKYPTTVWANGSYQKLVTGSFYVSTSVTVNVKRKGTVDVLKVDADTNKPLANATFRFTYDGKTTDVKSGTDGKAKLGERLKAGSVVKVKEITAPSGYKLNGTEFSITVGENTNVSKTWTNERLAGAVELTKIADVDQKSLDGVVFTLYKSDGSILQDNLKTDTNGQLKVKDLTLGSYCFKEKASLVGFETDSKNYSFTITADVTEAKPVKLTITNQYKLSASKTVSDKNETGKTSNTWSAASDDFLQYDLTTSTVEKLGSRYLADFVIEDQFPAETVAISTVQVLAQGSDVTDQFTITKDLTNGKVIATAKSTALTTSGFYGKSYDLRTKMMLKQEVLTAKNKATLSFSKQGSVKTGTKTASSNAVTTTLPAFKLTVNHVTETEKALLKQVVETKYDGESYEYKPLDDLFDVKGNRYRSKVTRSGVVAGKDLVLEIPYYLPSLEINAEKVSILTGKASLTDSLKATITFSKSASYEEELKNVLYRLTVTDQKQKKTVFTKDISLGSYASSLVVDLPTAGFTKGEKVPYSLSLQVLKNPDKVKAETDTIDFSTFGYTASEKVLTNADLKNDKLSYGAVSQTEATRKTKAYVEKKETLQFDFEEQRSSKTGYGLPITLEPIYSSEIQDTPLLSFTLSSPTKLVDTYLDLQYVESKGNIQIPLDRTVNQVAKQTTAAITSTKFEFPQISVEEKTGALYTQEQVKNPTKKIPNKLLDGGRKFYLPIWAEKGDYNLTLQSNVIGRNFIQVSMNQTLSVYANMYATIDSKTKKEDELLLTPVYPDTTVPKGWSKAEITWLRGK
ncbi:MSCRAMM family protein [Enterococcus casseliflavus]|uniref:MSCRAMM family protein n=1 Tax=Enterococcus casseliflavus TaxID=37734 RepID=UPI002890E6E6|nr:SpaA isopeptide-forming pilin-related protein [Enterococcus casseliflavus]MDT2974664.1 SpaA isopeptide-forming pilin-related protein [Enterococcus casseliflavus]